jgi:hypothetical protein
MQMLVLVLVQLLGWVLLGGLLETCLLQGHVLDSGRAPKQGPQV